jgi:hypothetical protein
MNEGSRYGVYKNAPEFLRNTRIGDKITIITTSYKRYDGEISFLSDNTVVLKFIWGHESFSIDEIYLVEKITA